MQAGYVVVMACRVTLAWRAEASWLHIAVCGMQVETGCNMLHAVVSPMHALGHFTRATCRVLVMACRLRLSWDRVIDPQAKYVFLDKRVRGAQANVDVRKLMQEALGQDIDQGDADQASVSKYRRLALHPCPRMITHLLVSHREDCKLCWSSRFVCPHATCTMCVLRTLFLFTIGTVTQLCRRLLTPCCTAYACPWSDCMTMSTLPRLNNWGATLLLVGECS